MADRPTPRPPRVDARGLREAALRHLERFACSSAGLRRVLERRVQRAEMRGAEIDHAAVHDSIGATIHDLERLGILNDERHAEMRAGSLHQRGYGRRRILNALARDGIGEADIANALNRLAEELGGEEGSDLDITAARRFAKRRRIGPYRIRAVDDQRRQYRKDLAALARAGFELGLSRRVLDEVPDE